MYGICNYCGHQGEAVDSAHCPECDRPWNVFLAKPKEVEPWKQRKGWLERVRRSLPPWAVKAFVMALMGMVALIPVDMYAAWKGVYVTRFTSIPMWVVIALFDAFVAWQVFRALRLSLRGFAFARFLITINLGGTAVAWLHNWINVIGVHVMGPAGTYLSIRVVVLMFTCYVIWLPRIERAIQRHGSPSS